MLSPRKTMPSPVAPRLQNNEIFVPETPERLWPKKNARKDRTPPKTSTRSPIRKKQRSDSLEHSPRSTRRKLNFANTSSPFRDESAQSASPSSSYVQTQEYFRRSTPASTPTNTTSQDDESNFSPCAKTQDYNDGRSDFSSCEETQAYSTEEQEIDYAELLQLIEKEQQLTPLARSTWQANLLLHKKGFIPYVGSQLTDSKQLDSSTMSEHYTIISRNSSILDKRGCSSETGNPYGSVVPHCVASDPTSDQIHAFFIINVPRYRNQQRKQKFASPIERILVKQDSINNIARAKRINTFNGINAHLIFDLTKTHLTQKEALANVGMYLEKNPKVKIPNFYFINKNKSGNYILSDEFTPAQAKNNNSQAGIMRFLQPTSTTTKSPERYTSTAKGKERVGATGKENRRPTATTSNGNRHGFFRSLSPQEAQEQLNRNAAQFKAAKQRQKEADKNQPKKNTILFHFRQN